MLGSVRVLSADDYRRWLETGSPGESRDLAAAGLEVAARRGCLSCHTIDGQPHIGPTWAGLYGSSVKLDDGRTVVADDAYLTRSMMEPAGEVVAGFKAVMPTYRGVLEEPEVAALVELMAVHRGPPHRAQCDASGRPASATGIVADGPCPGRACTDERTP